MNVKIEVVDDEILLKKSGQPVVSNALKLETLMIMMAYPKVIQQNAKRSAAMTLFSQFEKPH